MKMFNWAVGVKGRLGWIIAGINTALALFGIVLTVIGVKTDRKKLRNFGFIWTALFAIDTGRIGKMAIDAQEDTVFEPYRETIREN